jgi:predicted amidohydrolase
LVSDQSFGSEEVFVVNLDLKKFYNTIDIPILLERLKTISTGFGHETCNKFWSAVELITSWTWKDEDLKLAKRLDMGDIETGLPQGLVSAGFFANAYLTDFDRKVGEKLGSPLSKNSRITLHDYCRYVDDLRLVVSVDGASAKEVAKEINDLFTTLLKKYGGSKLTIHPDKTKVTALSDLDNKGSMANRIEMIQGELSGPADREVLDSTAGILESLLSVEESPIPALTNDHLDSSLLQISNFDDDIRPDTLKRFAANRLESIVRSKRSMSVVDSVNDSGEGLNDSENELLAKKLIIAWMKDPSLALVLRKAIEIYPNSDLFEPVFDSIFKRSSFVKSKNKTSQITTAMMDYLLADLFRCAIDFNGYFQIINYPKSINPQGIIELITRYAQKVICAPDTALFATRQALMLLAVTCKPVLIKADEPIIQHDLHLILVNNPGAYKTQRAALFEIAAQITGQFDTYASLFIENINDLEDQRYKALEVFAKRGGPFWLSLWKQINKKTSFKTIIEHLKWAAPQVTTQPKPRKQLLSKVISSDINGFEFEHGLIKLALGLICLTNESEGAIGRSPNELNVKISSKYSWDKIWSSNVLLEECSLAAGKRLYDPRFAIPQWVEVNGDNKAIYWIGMILRAAALGGADFTGNRWREGKTITYKGLRTSWYKRRMGMMHSPELLVGDYSTLSGWSTDLLKRCLQWPGFESTYVNHADVALIFDLKSFKKCLQDRLAYLNTLICKSSELPMLPTVVNRPERKEGFRIVTVQQLLPRSSDFSIADAELNNPNFRAKHQDHLRSVCRLTMKTLEAKLKVDDKASKSSADLIVFPEVSVHIDDQDILKRLADKTQAIIFAGLVFTDHKGKLVNIARWFIPDYRESGRQWIIRDQGKEHMTVGEQAMGISGHRPCQHLIEVHGDSEGPFRITGAICYDATDIKLAADLKNKTDLFVVCAHNKDVHTFDNMALALQYHMYQHVVISNIGEFGGSTIQAPFKEPYHRLISHVHGVGQIAISTADIDLNAFRRKTKKYKAFKAKPAGL